ncbi:MAG: hypothetical protein LC749_06400, partial [Actinobacteria bacterium]|nr:hypothetical protein [Actinomycetota bacterium]
SHPFTPDINALAGAGVTTGCTPDHLNFCPSANISREAEAAFVHRAMPRVAQFETDLATPIVVSTGDGPQPINFVHIVVPGVPGGVPSQGGDASQFVKVDGTLNVTPTTCTGERQVALQLQEQGGPLTLATNGTLYPCAASSVSISHVFSATPGSHSYYIVIQSYTSSAAVSVGGLRLQAMTFPFGEVGDRVLGG